MRPRWRGFAGIASLAALAGCTLITDSFLRNEFSGDEFPIAVETSSGAIVAGVRIADRDRTAVLDLLAQFTSIDPGASASPSLAFSDITLLGADRDGNLSLPRARFPGAQVISLHPCSKQVETCSVGPSDTARPFGAVLGADALAGDALRLRIGDAQVFVLADIAGNARGRTLACDAVFPSPYRGGGTMIIDDTELPFGNRRLTVQACLGQDLDGGSMAPKPHQRGADALFVVSTSIGVSLLDESAYLRYLRSQGLSPPAAPPPSVTVMMPSGPVVGYRATINRLALVASSSANSLAPCRQVYAHAVLTPANCDPRVPLEDQPADGCPCEDGSTFCVVPAHVAIAPDRAIDILVVPDTNQTLQDLRTELRPDQPEVDGLLGTDVLASLEIDVDYPHDRMLARCAGNAGGCRTRPALNQERDRAQIQGCIGEAATPAPAPP